MPLIIGIGGAESGAGKTSFGELLIRKLPGWGAVKVQKTGIYTALIDDEKKLSTPGKDTARYLGAGAERVFLVQSPGGEEMEEALSLAVSRLSGLAGIIIEGNSAIEVLKPDIVIFISANDIKNTALGVLEIADAVLGKEAIDKNKKARHFSDPEECAAFVLKLADERRDKKTAHGEDRRGPDNLQRGKGDS